MTLDEIRVLNDLVAAAKMLRDEHPVQADAGFLASLEKFATFAEVDDDTLKEWKITRVQHERVVAAAFQQLKTGSPRMQ